MTTAILVLAAAGCAFFLGLLAGGLARTSKVGDEQLRWACENQRTVEDFDAHAGAFDQLRQLSVAGKPVYSITFYGDGSGDFTLSERRQENDLTSYGGTT